MSKNTQTVPPEAAFQILVSFVSEAAIAGATKTPDQILHDAQREIRLSESPSITFTWSRGWATETRICVRLHKDEPLAVEVGWAASTYDSASARVAAHLHGEVADLALAIAHRFDNLRIAEG